MKEHVNLEDDRRPGRSGPVPAPEELVAPTEAVFDAAGGMRERGRGSAPAVSRAIDGLHASAGNEALAHLFQGARAVDHRDGRPRTSAARAPLAGTPAVQRAGGDDDSALDETATGGDAGPASGDTDATELGTGAPTPGPSWTKVGPHTDSTYNVSGSLRDVANAVSARTEAGSVTATPSRDLETWTPDGGEEQVIAARVTIAQVMELPTWTDKSSATKNQQAEWDRFHAAITTHENGHVATDKTSFAGTHTKMLRKTSADADADLDTVAAQAKTKNDTYDTTTQHGLTQGTGINPNIDEVTKVP
jgi:hypothetical protein